MKAQAHILKTVTSAAIALVSITVPYEFVNAQSITYTGGMQYSTGTYYFTEHINSVYISNGLSMTGDHMRVFFTVPFVIQSSPWISYSPGGGIPTGGMHQGQVGEVKDLNERRGRQDMIRRGGHQIDLQDTVSYRQSSFSDPSLGGSWRFFRSASGYTILNLNSSVKFPLADPQTGFGTGGWDVGAGMSVFQRISSFFLSGDVMYWQLGNMDELILENPLSVSVGGGKAFFDGTLMANILFTGSTRMIEGFDPPASLAAGVGYFISAGTSLNGNFSFGLSESSPAFSAGIGWSVRL